MTAFVSCNDVDGTACDATATFDLSNYPSWSGLSLSIDNMHGDLGGTAYSGVNDDLDGSGVHDAYAEVYVGGIAVPDLQCMSGAQCDSDSTWSCLTGYDVTTFVEAGASFVQVTLNGASGSKYCDPPLAADVVLAVSGVWPTPVPTATPQPTSTPGPTPRFATLSTFVSCQDVCDATATFDLSSYGSWRSLSLSINNMFVTQPLNPRPRIPLCVTPPDPTQRLVSCAFFLLVFVVVLGSWFLFLICRFIFVPYLFHVGTVTSMAGIAATNTRMCTSGAALSLTCTAAVATSAIRRPLGAA